MIQKQLEEFLKKKGIGPEGSKSLKENELSKINSLLNNNEASLTTKATLLTALLTLAPTDAEQQWLNNIAQTPEAYLPKDLTPFFNQIEPHPFWKIIRKLISNTELSVNEAEEGMQLLFDTNVPEYLKASFLEGARLKRETFSENSVFFSQLYNRAQRIQTNLPVIIDIADNYDGSNRTRNYSIFVAATLASLNIPCLVHGLDKVAPKEGHTAHQILIAGGKNPYISLQQAEQQLSNKNIQWAYVDQKVYFPELYALKNMRKEMVKRPFLATFEKLLQPVRAISGNYIVTGFTHPHYRTEVVNQLKAQGFTPKALVLKGMEGSTHLSMTKPTIAVLYNGFEILDTPVEPKDFALPPIEEFPDKTVNASLSLQEGIAALKGEVNMAREKILYLSLVIISKFELMDMAEAKSRIMENLDSGKILTIWEAGNNLQ